MSASQFDDLLGEFGESTSPSAKAGANGAYDDDDFDPFGSSRGGEHAQNIPADAQITNGNASNGLDFEFDTTTASEAADQHHNMSTKNMPSDQLLDLESGSEGPHHDLSPGESAAHFKYEPEEEEVDLLGGYSDQHQDNSNLGQTSQQQYDDTDLLGDFEVLQKEDIVEQQYQSENFNGQFEEVRTDPHELEEQQFQDVDQYYPEPEEVVEEAGTGEEDQVEDAPAEYAPMEDDPVGDAPEEYAAVEDDPVEYIPVRDAPEEDSHAEDTLVEDAHVEEGHLRPPPIPDVEITESPDQNFSDQDDSPVHVRTDPIADVEAKEEVEEDEASAVGGEAAEVEHPSTHTSGIEHDSLVAENFGHDRREKDLEHYCMDREESDLMEEHEIVPEPQKDSLKLREQRSRSPSRSIGPDTQDEPERREPSPTPDTDTTEEVDTLRPRDDRSHAPSRSLEPEEKPKANDSADAGFAGTGDARRENRYSDAGLDRTHITADQWAGEESHHSSGRQTGKQDTTHAEPAAPLIKPREVPSAASAGYDSQQQYSAAQQDEEEEEGVYENEPAQRGDVARETDTDRSADLPVSGTAHSLREKFLTAQQEAAAPTRSKREITPPVHGAGGEYVSEPRGFVERYEGKADSGVFESQPVVKTDVITSNTPVEEARIESGFAKNTAAKFKELQSKPATPSGKKELTPDRTGRVEYVSEPRGHLEQYEGRAESGVFESEPVVNPDVVRSGEEVREELPERGTARNMADKFRQIGSDTASPAGARGKREITPDRSGRVEYVSEPRGQHTGDYDVRVDAGVFENQPQRNADVILSDTVTEEVVPERGYARNVAAKFKEMETTVKSPPLSPGRRKEFTPPREDERFHQAGVSESTPEINSDVVHSGDHLEEALPERGTAKNIAQRFRQLETDSKTPGSFKGKKEFTPPPGDSGVFENQPKQFHADYNRPPESGIIENQPLKRDDVVRGDEPPKYEVELPERGAAKNLVSKWKQMESEGTKVKSPGSGRQKEFTPPREEPRISEQRKSPRTPLSPSGNDQLDNGSVHPSDLPGQYQPQNEPTIFESTPQQRSDVLREADADWTEGMPKKDTAKKMLAKFQNIQAEANKQSPGPVPRKETETPRKTPRKDSTCSESESDSEHIMGNDEENWQDEVGRSKSMRAAIQAEKCGACEKTVYAMERLEMNKRVYHKACFRCTHCKAVLTPKTFAINNEVIFCTTHYKQLFATKGNYDEGFGRSQHKKRWNSNPDLSKDVDENDLS